MPRSLVLTTASKASLTGGTFADTLVANTGDSLSVANYGSGGARILEMWGMDSASVAEIQLIYTRPESTHDQQHGVRFMLASLIPGGAGNVGAQDMLPGYSHIPVFKSDTATIQVSGAALDAVLVSYITEYDDLPGVQGQFTDWATVLSMQKSVVGIRCDAVASATKGAYGATRAINADDDRLHANTNYAVLGFTTQTIVTTIALIGPAWGGQRIGAPGGALDIGQDFYFVSQSLKYGAPMIPWFNSNDKGNVLLQVADDATSTSPKIDVFLVELTGQPS